MTMPLHFSLLYLLRSSCMQHYWLSLRCIARTLVVNVWLSTAARLVIRTAVHSRITARQSGLKFIAQWLHNGQFNSRRSV